MPLNPKLKKKKTEEEKERAYTKQTNNVSLPTKKTYTPVMTEAKRAAQEIRNSVGDKTVNRHTDDKYGNAERGYSVSTKKETPKETKKPYASSYKGVNRESLSQHRKGEKSFGTAQRDEQLWGLSSTAGGKLISNFYDSALDNSPIGAVATLATGERPSNYFNQNNPYNDIRTEGVSAGIGRMAGMAANYGMLRTAFNPQLDKAATAVMNGTKLGDAIKGSGVLGKIGQTVGRGTAQDIASGLIRETISDATIGAGTNAIINYGEGLRGSDFWRQQAKDTALDFLIGGAMEGVGIGKQIGRASGQAKALAGENVVNMLANSETKRDYINNLVARHNELLANTSGETARALRNASTAKAAEYKDEFGKIINMTDEEFNAYRKSKLPSSAGEPEVKPVEETKVKEPIQEEPAPEEPIDEELDIEPELEGASRHGGFNRPTKGYASAQGRYDAYTGRKKPTEAVENATVKASENVDTAGKLAPQKEMELEPEKPVKETATKKKSNKGKKKADQQAEMVLEQKPKETKPPAEEKPKAESKPAEQPKVETEEGEYKPSDAINHLDKDGEVVLGQYGRMTKMKDGKYEIFRPGYGAKTLTREEAEDYITKSVNALNKEIEAARPNRVSPLTKAEQDRVKEIDEKISELEKKGGEEAKKLKDNKYKGTEKYWSEQGKRGREITNLSREKQKILNKEPEAKRGLPTEAQVKAEAKVEAPKERAKVNMSMNKSTIIERMKAKGIELPEGAENWSKQNLIDLNNGKTTAESLAKKSTKRQAKKTEINLFDYEDIYNVSKDDDVIKEGLLNKYIDDYRKLGTPLDNNQVAELKKLNADEMFDRIEKDALSRSGFKNADEYHAKRLYAKEEAKPELVRKADREAETLKSESLKKGKSDAYTSAPKETDAYFGREVKTVELPANELDKKIDDFLTPRMAQEVYPTPKVIATKLDIDENYVRKFLDKSDKYMLDGNNVKPKTAASSTVSSAEGNATETMAGYTATFGNASRRNKGLPQKLTKERASNVKEKRFATLDNADELTKSNKKKQKEIELDSSKVDDIKIETGEPRTSIETGAPKEKTVKEKLQSLWKKARRDIIDSTDEFRRIDKTTGKTKLQEKYKMSQGSRAQAGHQLVTEITDRKGNAIKFKNADGNEATKSFREVFKPFEKHMDDVSLYMYNKHEIDRALQSNKNALSLSIYGYTKEEAQKAADAVVNAYPELKKQRDAIASWLEDGMQNNDAYRAIKSKADGFENVVQKLNQIKSDQAKATVEALEKRYKAQGLDLDKMSKEWKETYEKWFDEWATKSGLVDKDLVKEWRGKYHNYIPTFRVKDISDGSMKIFDSPDVFHSVKGKTDAKLLNVEDQIGIMINRVTSAARRNELNLSILKAIQDNPDKGWGKIISVDDNLIGDIDDALKTVAGSAGDIINGSKKLTVLADGKKITLEISDDLAATLRAMQDAADTGIMTRLGKWITNPIKLGITGANPTFVVSNAVRDMATALIQSEHGMGKTITGWGKALAGMTGINKEYANLLKRYKFAGGEMAGYYVQGKGFDTSAILQQKGVKGVMNKVGQIITFLGEQGETVPRFGEFINTMEKTGDFYKAVRDAAEVTVDFSKHGASDGAKLLDAWTLYLNAGLQGIDKFAKTLAEHPKRTTGRTALMVGTPAIALLAVNNDNPWYWELSDRTRQNYFCIPKLDGEVDEDGNCKEFIRLPMNREYGAVLGAGMDSIWRGIKGEENPTSGFATTLSENFLPNNPITDNVLAPLLINIPSNQDYKGAKILTTSEFEDFKAGKNADLQYDAKTSGTAMKVSELANKVMGDKNIPILKYLKSPKLVDYVLDSYGGYYGEVAQSATQQGINSVGEAAENMLIRPYANKFTTDPRYSSQTMDEAWDKIAEYKSDQKRAADEGKEWSEEHAKYEAANKVMKAIYESLDAEKAIKNDDTLSESEKKKLTNELREARLELAKTIDTEAEAAAKEYKEAPTYSSLQDTVKEKWSEDLKMSKEEWAKLYKQNLDEYNVKKEKTGKGTTADEKRYALLENGVTSYKVAQSILGDNTSKDKWDEAKKDFKNGKTLEEVQAEAKAQAEKEEQQKDWTKEQKNFENYFKANVTTNYDGKTVSKKAMEDYINRAKYADSKNDGNGSITQKEARAALDSMNLTRAQKAYLWSITKDWKTNPYD